MNFLIGITIFHVGLLLLSWAIDGDFNFMFFPFAIGFWGVSLMLVGIAWFCGAIGI